MRMGFAAWEENTLLAMLDAVSNVYQFRTDDNNAIFPIEAIKIVDISWERSKSHPTFPSLSISRCPSHTVGNLFIALKIWYIQRKRCAQRISHVDSSNMHFVLRLCVQLCGCGRANHSVNGSNNCSAFRFASAVSMAARIDSMRNHFDLREIKNDYRTGFRQSARDRFMPFRVRGWPDIAHSIPLVKNLHNCRTLADELIRIIELLSVTEWQARKSIEVETANNSPHSQNGE